VSCKLCNHLRPKRLARLNADIAAKQKSLSAIADKYDLPLRGIVRHARRCVGAEQQSGHDTMQSLLKQVVEDLEVVRENSKYAEGEEAKSSAVLYTGLLREARELVMGMNRLRPNEAIIDDLTATVINPLLNAMAEVLIKEGGNLKRDLQSTLGTSYTKHTDLVLKESWKRIATSFRVEASKINPLLVQVLDRDHATSSSAKTTSAEPSKQSLLSAQSPSSQIH
jgi:hypothetical protein